MVIFHSNYKLYPYVIGFFSPHEVIRYLPYTVVCSATFLFGVSELYRLGAKHPGVDGDKNPNSFTGLVFLGKKTQETHGFFYHQIYPPVN